MIPIASLRFLTEPAYVLVGALLPGDDPTAEVRLLFSTDAVLSYPPTARPILEYLSVLRSEADVVVVSLVRNNPRVGLGAVGFLRERRRLNVMLSRAKHKLVLVGSLSFLVEAARGVNPGGGEHGLAFLDRMVEAIHDLALEERCPGLPLTSIIGPETLRRRP